MTYSKLLLSAMAVAALTFTGCGGGDDDTTSNSNENSGVSGTAPVSETPASTVLTGDITKDTRLTADKTWTLDGLVAVKNGATLTIEPGTKIVAEEGDGANTSYLVIDKGAKIIANGTADKHIVFTSKDENPGAGKWGGVVIIGNAAMDDQVEPYEANTDFTPGKGSAHDSSGSLKYVDILNSGITMEKDKEINGLSFVAVGDGTVVENIYVKDSDDDCVEVWGGTVNMTNVEVTGCTDDFFDIDDGFSGTVTGLKVVSNGTGNAGIEMSGNTHATFKDFDITVIKNNKEGGIYFKKAGIGGHFENGTVTMGADSKDGAIFSKGGKPDVANISFKNVTLKAPGQDQFFVTDEDGDAESIKQKFEADSSNKTEVVQ